MLPLDVIERAALDLANHAGSGQSVMEMSHRSKEFETIIKDAEKNLRNILKVPENYKVIFLQGGATLQFAMVPLNLMRGAKKADYIVTGAWAKKAAEEAAKFGDVRIAATSEESKFTYIPEVTESDFRRDADYVHITFNNTIYGTHYPYVPDTGDVPLVCDMSSSILSEEIDVGRFGLIYAGAQKNIGPAGVTLVLIREDLLGFAGGDVPTYLDYKIHADSGSMYNTPPCFAIYIAGEVFKKIKSEGGIAAMERANREKGGRLYDHIDESGLFRCPVVRKDRSLMNVVFLTGDEKLDKKFTSQAEGEGLCNLGGHRTIGGMRASIYNAMPAEGIEKLISFMKKFEEANGR